MTYLYDLAAWPSFTWDATKLAPALNGLRLRQGRLLGKMESLGFDLQRQAALESLVMEVVKTSEIEGEHLPLTRCAHPSRASSGWTSRGSFPRTGAWTASWRC
ncbi:MAG: DUF4172 domain-containing protein [Elusimicrobiota bacterium]|nr:MAG: DUF4172 domain-containing protein [Elusimicrobiota bacterium]